MIELAIIIVLYSFIWFVPVAISSHRRKKGKPVYWLLFLGTLILEIGVIFFCIFIQNAISLSENLARINVFAAPILASVIAGFFYYFSANKLDEKNT